MYRYEFMSDNGTQLWAGSFTTATIACNAFLGRFARAARANGTPEHTVLTDVVVTTGGRVVAVISDRGNRRPDVMILDYMRSRILAG